jgi:hypothetical protein
MSFPEIKFGTPSAKKKSVLKDLTDKKLSSPQNSSLGHWNNNTRGPKKTREKKIFGPNRPSPPLPIHQSFGTTSQAITESQ